MALVLMATHGWGTLFIDPSDLEAGVGLQSSFTNPADATAVTHYADDAFTGPSTGPVTADANGRLMRYVEEGTYTQTLPGGTQLEVQAVSGSTLASIESEVVKVDIASATIERQRPRWKTSTSKLAWAAPDVVDLRDWDGIRPWETSTGYVMTSGSPLMTCTASPFTSADVGKIVIAKQSASLTDPLYMATILSVAGGVATMSSNAPASVPGGQRGQRGFDMETALNAALLELAADNFDTRRCHLPGLIRASQIVIPQGIDFDGGFLGCVIPTPGGIGDLAKRTDAGTWFQQLPGAQKDFLILEKYIDGGASRNWGGIYGISNLCLLGPEQSVIGKTWTLGSGFAAVASDGDPLAMLDGFHMGHRGPIYASGFPQDGFYFPDGGVPLFLDRLRPFFNGRYGVNIEVRSNAGSQGGNSPSTHILNLSGDGNASGLARFSGFGNWASIVITNCKSEKADYWPTLGSPASPSSPTAGMLQESSLIFDDCDDTPVVINGSTHISAAPGGTHTDAPGPHILVRSATDLRPQISARGIGTRRIVADELTNLTNGVDLRDSVIGVDVPYGTKDFDWPPRNNQPGMDQRLVGEETYPRSVAATTATMTSGNLRGCMFTCKKTATRSKIMVPTVGAAGATPTINKVAVWTEDPTTLAITCVAVSANSLGKMLVAATQDEYTLTVPYKFLAGRRYAITLLIVTAAAAPTVSSTGAMVGGETAMAPRLCFGYGGRTDVAISDTVSAATLAGAANTGNRPYFVLLP